MSHRSRHVMEHQGRFLPLTFHVSDVRIYSRRKWDIIALVLSFDGFDTRAKPALQGRNARLGTAWVPPVTHEQAEIAAG